MKLPKLFKYSTTGALQEWEIEVDHNQYRTHSGQVGGAITITEWTTCLGKNTGKKNETTDDEQALKDANAKWVYQIQRNQYKESIAELSGVALFIQPMLAKNYTDRKNKINFNKNVFVQIKLNGVRAVITKDGIFSRKGLKYVSSPHISEELAAFFNENPDVVLDGELCNYELRKNLNKVISLVKQKTPTVEQLQESKELVQFHLYDVMLKNTIYSDRLVWMDTFYKKYIINDNSSIRLVPARKVLSHNEIDGLLALYEADGEEGVMVRLDEVYENKRSSNLLKYKNFTDDEFLIVGTVEGKGNLAGMIGTFSFVDSAGKRFEASPVGTHEHWKDLWRDRDSLVGKKAKVKYKELTPLKEDGTGGVPSFGKVLEIRDYE
jgi:ATP-dependent DNA ligase